MPNNEGGRTLDGGASEPLPEVWRSSNGAPRVGRIGNWAGSGPAPRKGRPHEDDDDDDDDDDEADDRNQPQSWFTGGERRYVEGLGVTNRG